MNKLYNRKINMYTREKYPSVFFFGIDGTGKTSVAKKLVEIMIANERPAVLYDTVKRDRKNPFHHSVFSELNYQDKKMELAMNVASYTWQSCKIREILGNAFFIRDRWIPDVIGSYLYQGNDTSLLWRKCQENDLVLVPDVSILLSVDENARKERVLQKDDRTDQDLDVTRLRFLSEQLKINLSVYPNLLQIDTTDMSIDQVARMVYEHIENVVNSSS